MKRLWLSSAILAAFVCATGPISPAMAGLEPIGPAGTINVNFANNQEQADVASDRMETIVWVWQSEGQDGDQRGIIGSYGPGEFPINQATAGDQYHPAVDFAPDGDFLYVVWVTGGVGIFGRPFDPGLTPLDDETLLVADQKAAFPQIRFGQDGRFFLSWMTDIGSTGPLQTQGFDVDGSPFTQAVILDPDASVERFAMDRRDEDGATLIAWVNSDPVIDAAVLDDEGTVVVDPFPVDISPVPQFSPDVVFGPDGDVVIVWVRFQLAYSRRFDGNFSPDVPYQLSELQLGVQDEPTIDVAGDGSYVAAWRIDSDRIDSRCLNADAVPFGGTLVIHGNDGLQPEVTFFDSTGLVFTWQEWFGHYDVRARGYTMTTVSVEDAQPAPVSTLKTLARPSVFRTDTTIEFDVASQGRVSLTIYDTAGRHVRTLFDGAARGRGRHEVHWDGRDARGGRVPTGVYFYSLETGGPAGDAARGRMVRVR